jgi:hypothetical protein
MSNPVEARQYLRTYAFLTFKPPFVGAHSCAPFLYVASLRKLLEGEWALLCDRRETLILPLLYSLPTLHLLRLIKFNLTKALAKDSREVVVDDASLCPTYNS